MVKVKDEDRKKAYVERGRQREVLAFFWATPGRVIRIEELEKQFKGKYTRNQLMGTMAHVCTPAMKAKYNYPIERISQGVWRLVEPKGHEETPKPEPTTKPLIEDHMLVEVLKEKDTFLLVEDTADGKIYKMHLVG